MAACVRIYEAYRISIKRKCHLVFRSNLSMTLQARSRVLSKLMLFFARFFFNFYIRIQHIREITLAHITDNNRTKAS